MSHVVNSADGPTLIQIITLAKSLLRLMSCQKLRVLGLLCVTMSVKYHYISYNVIQLYYYSIHRGSVQEVRCPLFRGSDNLYHTVLSTLNLTSLSLSGVIITSEQCHG